MLLLLGVLATHARVEVEGTAVDYAKQATIARDFVLSIYAI